MSERTGSEAGEERLLDAIGLDAGELAQRKAVTGFTEADERRLTEMKPVVDEAVEDLVEGYYGKVTSYSETREILDASPDSARALEQSQRQYLSDLTSGRYGQEYFERRARIGRVHDVYDLGPKSYFAGYTAYYEGVVRAIAEDVKSGLVASDGGVDDGRSGDSPDADAPSGRHAPGSDRRSHHAEPHAPDRPTPSPDREAVRRSTPIFEGQEYPPEDPRHDDGSASGRQDEPDDDVAPAEPRDERPGTPRGEAVADGDADTLGAREAVDLMSERVLSFLKLATLDQQVAMETYTDLYRKRAADEIARQEQVTQEVEATVTELEYAAEEVARSSQEISAMAVQQSESTETVAGEVSNLSATVEEVASTAVEVEATSEEAEALAVQGKESATEAIEMMESVNDSAARVTSDVGHLQERVNEIDDIVEVINDIADQTNLLALNASIEAARAGEAGAGFAVVADEVKSLAEKSQEQVGQIEGKIASIQEDTGETVASLTETNDEIDRGIDQVEDAMENLTEIVEAVKETAVGISEVADATDDQAATTTEITEMVEDVAQSADEIREHVEAVAAANEQQTAQVAEIGEAVDNLVDEN